jgi:hypothetical protein
MLRESKLIADYNFREYALRRTKLGFQQGKKLAGEDLKMALDKAQEGLGVIKRTAIMGGLYPHTLSVMEVTEKEAGVQAQRRH